MTSADVAFYFISADWGEMNICTLIMEKQIKSLMTKIYNIKLEAGKIGQMRGHSFVGKPCIQHFMFYSFSCDYLSFVSTFLQFNLLIFFFILLFLQATQFDSCSQHSTLFCHLLFLINKEDSLKTCKVGYTNSSKMMNCSNVIRK